jgi:hypothetical protein
MFKKIKCNQCSGLINLESANAFKYKNVVCTFCHKNLKINLKKSFYLFLIAELIFAAYILSTMNLRVSAFVITLGMYYLNVYLIGWFFLESSEDNEKKSQVVE